MNQDDSQNTERDGDQRRQQQADVLGLSVSRQTAQGKNDRNSGKDVDDDGHDSLMPHHFSESALIRPLGRVGEAVNLLLQRLILRLQFGVLRLKLGDLVAEGIYLRKRDSQLKLRLLRLIVGRRWHVQLPPDDETDVKNGARGVDSAEPLEASEHSRAGIRTMANVEGERLPTGLQKHA